jgi:hypothetical protein
MMKTEQISKGVQFADTYLFGLGIEVQNYILVATERVMALALE